MPILPLAEKGNICKELVAEKYLHIAEVTPLDKVSEQFIPVGSDAFDRDDERFLRWADNNCVRSCSVGELEQAQDFNTLLRRHQVRCDERACWQVNRLAREEKDSCRWHFEEIGVRFGLIPPSDAGILNPFRVADATMLNLQVGFSLPNNGVVDVDAVSDDAVVSFADAAVKWGDDMPRRKIPAAVEVILRARSVENPFAVNIKQLVPLQKAKPCGALHCHCGADEVSSRVCRFQELVVSSLAGEPPEPLGVEVAHLRQFRSLETFTKQGNAQVERFVETVFNFNPRRFSKGHREVAIANAFVRKPYKARVEVDWTETAAEEISERRLHAGRFFSVPVNSQNCFSPSQKLLWRNCDEQALGDGWTSQLKDRLLALWVNRVFLKGQVWRKANRRSPNLQNFCQGFKFRVAEGELEGSHFRAFGELDDGHMVIHRSGVLNGHPHPLSKRHRKVTDDTAA